LAATLIQSARNLDDPAGVGLSSGEIQALVQAMVWAVIWIVRGINAVRMEIAISWVKEVRAWAWVVLKGTWYSLSMDWRKGIVMVEVLVDSGAAYLHLGHSYSTITEVEKVGLY
jgi:hypothetical protein